jgi:hypothetical protein
MQFPKTIGIDFLPFTRQREASTSLLPVQKQRQREAKRKPSQSWPVCGGEERRPGILGFSRFRVSREEEEEEQQRHKPKGARGKEADLSDKDGKQEKKQNRKRIGGFMYTHDGRFRDGGAGSGSKVPWLWLDLQLERIRTQR